MRKEESNYGQFDEIDPPLGKRIRQYCRDLDFEEPRNIHDFAWSATFVSWCLFIAGVTNKEFKFHIRYAVFIKWAIQSQDKNTGLFRTHRIDEYTPQLSDFIANNRGGGKITYDEARPQPAHESFQIARDLAVAQFEKGYLTDMLLVHQGNITKAAQAAGKNRRAFWQLLRKHGIDTQSVRAAQQIPDLDKC